MSPKILFILHLPPPIHGAAMMGKYILDSKIINEEFDCHYINLSTSKDIRDIGKGGLVKILVFLRLLWSITKNIIALNPQLVYITPNASGIAFYKDFIVVLLIKWLGQKVVLHFHNKGVATRQNYWWNDILYRLFFKKTKTILLSNILYEDIKKYVHRDDVYICPNGIPETLTKELKIKDGETTTRFRLLFLSNLLESKGVIILLDSLKKIKDNGNSFTCDFVGAETAEINTQRFYYEIQRRGLQFHVEYLGRKYDSEKNRCFQEADLFVFPTYYTNECFPLVLLEAMSHSLPCISTNEAGIPDIIEDGTTGYIINKKDTDALADKLEYCITHPIQCKQMGEKGYQKFQENYTVSKFEKNIKKIIADIISQ